MNLVLDVNIVVDICAKRHPFYDDSLAAVVFSKKRGHRIWLYVGAVQTMEYTLGAELKRLHPVQAAPISNSAHGRKARELLQNFALDKNWLAALAGEGDVFSSNDPEDEQFIKSLDRFPLNDVIFLSRDNPMLNRQDPRVLSPVQYLEKFAPPPQDETGVHGESKPIDFIDLKTQQDSIRPGLEEGIHRVLHHGQYIMGPEVRKLEEQLSGFTGSAHAITCASGTDALLIALSRTKPKPSCRFPFMDNARI